MKKILFNPFWLTVVNRLSLTHNEINCKISAHFQITFLGGVLNAMQ
ncbi:protein of unknown function [Oenococcus oeni]|nr:hypothetical protein OENI_200027 [Oenococcus oeni]SYW18303.1 hypothetical protein OENI_30117 [Oenococcus oeni]VDC14205.1 protein of unknown function [Oenococcus oeni]